MKSLSIVIILLFFTSCFGGGRQAPSEETGLEVIEREEFSIFLPVNWGEVPQGELVIPSQGELVLGYRSLEAKAGYYNNITIIRNENKLQETDISLMNNNINTLRMSLQSFELIAEDVLNFKNGRERDVIVFRGKYGSQTPEANYIQTAVSCDDMSYFLTISVGSDLGDYTRYYPLLESFRCK